MTSPIEEYGPLVDPKRIKDDEKDDLQEIRLNPLWTPLDDLDPELVTNGSKNAVWLYSVTQDGRIMLGSEKVSDILDADQMSDLVEGIGSKNPSVTQEAVKAHLISRLDGLGHTGIAAQFDETTGKTLAGKSRVAGEFRWSEEREAWTVNDKSGRYMSRPVRPNLTPQDVEIWLGNVALAFQQHFKVPVFADRIKTTDVSGNPSTTVAQAATLRSANALTDPSPTVLPETARPSSAQVAPEQVRRHRIG
ncbi:hypothetical protein ACIPPJ_33500 [Streptomyces sp. NPDC086091]|uniref:hypothetical protein n=1 Tax=Streptomyces sp. NPDC086091 TaxID=3365751 RepID=UPI00382357B0